MTITGYKEAAERYQQCIDAGLSSSIMLDRNTGEVWATERVSDNDWTEYHDEAIVDLTLDALEMQNDCWATGKKAPSLAEAVFDVANRAMGNYSAVTA